MPWITANINAGHSEEQKRALHENIAKTVSETLEIPLAHVRIQLVEMEKINISVGGVAIDRL